MGLKRQRLEGVSGGDGRKRLEWGGWCELKAEEDVVSIEMLP